jgi:hypothetical protein
MTRRTSWSDLTHDLAAKTGEAAVKGARPLAENKYKIPLTKGVVRRRTLYRSTALDNSP